MNYEDNLLAILKSLTLGSGKVTKLTNRNFDVIMKDIISEITTKQMDDLKNANHHCFKGHCQPIDEKTVDNPE